MHSTPDEEALLGAALEVSDHALAASPPRPGQPEPAGALDATSRSLDRLALLADVAAAHVAAGAHEAGASPAAEPPALFAWGSLRVIGRLGEGTYGEVFAAWDPALQREVALKLRRAQAGTLRWLDEARALARVRHPNVLVVHGADLRDDRAGIWSERIHGQTLEELLAAGVTFPAREAARIARDVASALDAVHHTGLVHGDVTTRNVMLEAPVAAPAVAAGEAQAGAPQVGARSRDGVTTRRAVLMDFGTAAGEATASELGTPLAAAPELLAGGRPSAASDVYALGVLLFRLLTARYPVEAATLDELRERHARGERSSLGTLRRGVPAAVARVVDRALMPARAHRYASAATMRDALSRALGEFVPPVSPQVASLAIAGLIVMAITSALLVGQYRHRDANYFRAPAPPSFAMAQTAGWVMRLVAPAAAPAWHVSLDADFDRDGRRDALLGYGGYSVGLPSRGRAMLRRGDAGGLSDDALTLCVGSSPGQGLGDLVACPGDVNGDGWPDVLAGTVFAGSDPRHVGEMRLFLGGADGMSRQACWRVTGDSVYTAFGDGIAQVGDLNGDGLADILLPEHDWTAQRLNQGRVFQFLGSRSGPPLRPDQVLTDQVQSERFGEFVRGVGDVNGDRYGDVLIGAPEWQGPHGMVGCALLYLGGPNGLREQPAQRITGDESGDAVGYTESFSGIGDIDGDGFADVAIGITNHSGRAAGIGAVRVYRGGPHGFDSRAAWSTEGLCSASSFGRVVTCGDVNGDGRTDLVIGSPSFSRSLDAGSIGAVFVYLGTGSKPWFAQRPSWWAVSNQAESGFAERISVGDVNGDGADDIFVSAPLWHTAGIVSGREFLFLGLPQHQETPRPAGRAAPNR